MEEGALNGRPYFRRQNNTAKKDFFMFFSGRRWVVSRALGDEFVNLRSRENRPDLRDTFVIRLLQFTIHRGRVKKLSAKLPPEVGWQYSNPDWTADPGLLLEWLSPQPWRRMEGIKEVVSEPKIVLLRDILALEEAGVTEKKEIGLLLLLICWGSEKRRR